MRRFTGEYLERTREGMWKDSRRALEPLDLGSRSTVLDVGAGTGALTAVLREEAAGDVIAVDADPELLDSVAPPRLLGDARRLPIDRGTIELVVCQALLVNLPEPRRAIEEFVKVATDHVAVIEPDNAEVTVESTVDAESRLARQARERYLDGVETPAALGDAADLFHEIGLRDIEVTRYDHVRTIEGPYDEADVEAARRKVTGEGLTTDRATILAGTTTPAEFDDLKQNWRAMGREVAEQMRNGEYKRRETVPFYVTVGRIS
ncbi:MAG: class I SAM-dependent methyltransferase [Salinirussus sp.]